MTLFSIPSPRAIYRRHPAVAFIRRRWPRFALMVVPVVLGLAALLKLLLAVI